jgi:hypothetical protein
MLLNLLIQWSSNPAVLASLCAMVVVMLFLLWRRRKSGAKVTVNPVERYIKAGNFEAAARYEAEQGNLENAIELYAQARMPQRAEELRAQLRQQKETESATGAS